MRQFRGMKIVIALALLAVLAVLASAGLFMLRKKRDSGGDKRMAWALALRVGLSVALFLFILASYQMGWIKPTGLPIG